LTDHARAYKRSWKLDEQRLRNPLLKPWQHRRLSDITRDDVRLLYKRVSTERGPVTANRMLALVRKMFNCARMWDLLKSENPAQLAVTPFKETPRDRFLSPDELQRVLASIEQEPDEKWRGYFKLALLLGP